VLFPASPALFYGTSDDCVEVESGFAGSCTGVCAAFGSIDLKVVELAERFVKILRQLWELRLVGEWTELDLPMA
jgi:hypothetical protein